MNESAFQLQVDAGGIATLLFDLKGEKVNKFSLEVLEELGGIIDSLAKRSDIKALLFRSGKRDIFIAGADLNVFGPALKEPALLEKLIRNGHRTFRNIEKLPFPTVALIDGVCLGGGLECALAFTYRVVTDNPKTSLGLPEVTLGIIPGWGGTQRLPRLVGLQEGLGMILSGKPVNASKALKIHLADALVPAAFQDEYIQQFMTKILTPAGKKALLDKRSSVPFSSYLIEKNPLGRKILFSKAKSELLKKTKGHYLAPEIALNLIQESHKLDLPDGLEKEILCVLSNVDTGFSQASNLIGLFFTSEALKKSAGRNFSLEAKKIKSAAILGSGTMGAGISWLLANNDFPVRLKDLNWEFLGKGLASIHSQFKESLKYRKITPSQLNLRFRNVSGAVDYTGFKHADLVIEAATEDLALKNKIFHELEKQVSADAIIASNTSSLPISEMAKAFEHPERFLGLHFFNPVNRMPLVEVIPGEKTSEAALVTAIDLCRKIGKTPIIVSDCPGFLVNRIFMAGANEIMWMFQEGVSMQRIEKVLLDFGMPMSPFLLADEVGNDVGFKVAKTLEEAYGERMHCPEIVKLMAEKGFYGKKNGKGFYLYNHKQPSPNPEVQKLLSPLHARNSNVIDRDIKDRTVIAMVNEAARCIEEKVVSSPEYLDMAMIMGTGFPPFRGGVLKYADELSLSYIIAQLKNFESAYGPRFNPATSLIKMEAEGKTFYAK